MVSVTCRVPLSVYTRDEVARRAVVVVRGRGGSWSWSSVVVVVVVVVVVGCGGRGGGGAENVNHFYKLHAVRFSIKI